MLFHSLALVALSMAMVAGDGGLRLANSPESSANKIIELPVEASPHKGVHRHLQVERMVNGERRLTTFAVFNFKSDFLTAIDNLVDTGDIATSKCDFFLETFGNSNDGCVSGCGIGNPSGTGIDYPLLTWSTTLENDVIPYDTRVEAGKFRDRLTRADADKTTFQYPALEAFGATFDNGPNNPGTGLEIVVYADGDEVGTVNTQSSAVFWGVISSEPIANIMLTSGPLTSQNNQETYTVDDFYIFPWCSPRNNGLKGDPHVETWFGEYFDFMGQCDVVFLQDKAHDIDVHARTTIRYDYSYVESAAVRIGEDILEVSSFGEHSLNGVAGAFYNGNGYNTLGGYPIHYTMKNKRAHKFDIVLGNEANITIGVFKDLVSISTSGLDSLSYFEESTGIMGSVYGNLVGRDGVTGYKIKDQESMDAFGQEWQVGPEDPKLFQTDRAPQFPDKCIFPSESVKESRRLSQSPIEMEAAERACAHFAGATFQKCVYDVMAFGDLEVASSGIY